MSTKKCESCMMPLDQDPGVSGSEKYCSYCFKDGKLCYEGNDVKYFQKMCYEGMVKNGMNPLKAKIFTYFIKFAPRWKKTA